MWAATELARADDMRCKTTTWGQIISVRWRAQNPDGAEACGWRCTKEFPIPKPAMIFLAASATKISRAWSFTRRRWLAALLHELIGKERRIPGN